MLKTIFFPRNCCRAPPGILIGKSNADNTTLFVVAVVHFPVTPNNLNNYLINHHKQSNKNGNITDQLHVKLRPIGVWFPLNYSEDKDFRELVPKLFVQKSWVSVEARKHEAGEVAFYIEHSESRSNTSLDIFAENEYKKINTESVLVLYDQKEIWDGEFCDGALLKSDFDSGSIEALFATTRACKNGILSYKSGLDPDENVKVTHCCVHRELSLVFFLLTIFTTFVLTSLHFLINVVQNICGKLPHALHFILKLLDKGAQFSSFCSHIKRRFTHFSRSLTTFVQDVRHVRKIHGHRNVIASVFADILFGLTLLWVLYYYDVLWSVRTTKEVFLPYVDGIAKQVEELIKWLMGIPAGLKLNSPLNQFLGHFFLYHVRLWLEYAKMMMDFFPHLITYCLMSSCLGLSFFLSVISDAVSTLSFHVYCFYVYAGRLYGLQVSGLMSLWRLFRGKKWNPLRKRVDSLEESGQRADQLFAGTLLFTVLLFLLPTTALYYGIFMLLRVAVLAIQIILSSLMFAFSEFPWYSLGLRLLKPHKFIKSVRMSLLNPTFNSPSNHGTEDCERTDHQPNQAMTVDMQVDPLPVLKVVETFLSQRRQSSGESAGARTFLKKIVVGELVRWS